MKVSNRYKEAFERAKQSPAFWTETALLEVAGQLLQRMKALGISQKALAEKMGAKAPFVNRVLSGKHNVTIETLSTAAHALGMRIDVRLVSMDEKASPAHEKLITVASSPAKDTESITAGAEILIGAKNRVLLQIVKVQRVEGTLTGDPQGTERLAA